MISVPHHTAATANISPALDKVFVELLGPDIRSVSRQIQALHDEVAELRREIRYLASPILHGPAALEAFDRLARRTNL